MRIRGVWVLLGFFERKAVLVLELKTKEERESHKPSGAGFWCCDAGGGIWTSRMSPVKPK